jgi:DNA invertase Pin-like site-specific DNA recombinase
MGGMVLIVLGMVAAVRAWLHPRSATRRHRRRKGEGHLQRPSGRFDRARIAALRKGGMGATEIAKGVGCKRGNVYKALKAAGLN